MKVHAWVTSEPNFGDDLNFWFWDALIPDLVATPTDALFVGIGSVLGRSLPPAPMTIVMGSGAGYASLPEGFGGPAWRIYGVRGPLSARLCGLGRDKILADPAILLPKILPAPADDGPRPVRFVPHLKSAGRSPWADICAKAGVELLDPRGEAKDVVRALASSKLVLAESMHAAIIADAYRVPWIPLWSTREISLFKWLDWSLALGASVQPSWLPAPSPMSWFDDVAAGRTMNDNARIFPAPERPLDMTDADYDVIVAAMKAALARRDTPGPQRSHRNYMRLRKRVLTPGLARLGAGWSARCVDRCAEAMRGFAAMDGRLSPDAGLAGGIARLEAAIDQLRKDGV